MSRSCLFPKTVDGLTSQIARLHKCAQVSMLLVLGTSAFWAILFFTHGTALDSYIFVYDGHFWGSDYFGPLYMMQHWTNPWEGGINYPAGAYVFYRIFYHFIPQGSVAQYSDALMGRTYAYAILGLIITYVLHLIPTYFLTKRMVGDKGPSGSLFALATMLCGPALAAIVFGNIVLICVPLIYFYIEFHSSEDANLRWLSYILLAVAASIKVYPVVYLGLVLVGKHRREFIPACFISLGLFLAPFFWFEGVDSIYAFINNFIADAAWKSDWGVGYVVSFQGLVKLVSLLIGSYYNGELSGALKIVPLLIALALFFTSSEEWKRLFACAIACIWFPTMSWTYMLILLVPVLARLVNESSDAGIPRKAKHDARVRFSKGRAAYSVAITLLLIPYATPKIEGINSLFFELKQRVSTMVTVYPASWGTVIIDGLLLIITATMLFDNVSQLISTRTSMRHHTKT